MVTKKMLVVYFKCEYGTSDGIIVKLTLYYEIILFSLYFYIPTLFPLQGREASPRKGICPQLVMGFAFFSSRIKNIE